MGVFWQVHSEGGYRITSTLHLFLNQADMEAGATNLEEFCPQAAQQYSAIAYGDVVLGHAHTGVYVREKDNAISNELAGYS